VQYCRWFEDFLTANGEDILDIAFLVVKYGSIYPGMPAPKNRHMWRVFNPHKILETLLHDQRLLYHA
jgi:hypothetical protein